MQDEKNLKVYKESIQLAKDVYLIKFPSNELFGLQSQIRRAVTSIPLLIAEGCGRETNADTRHFWVQARGSCKEVQTALELGKELSFIDLQTYTKIYDKADYVGKMLTNLIKTIGGENNGKKQTASNEPPRTNN